MGYSLIIRTNRFSISALPITASPNELLFYRRCIRGRNHPGLHSPYRKNKIAPPGGALAINSAGTVTIPTKKFPAVAKAFRERDIPADVIVLDIHYMEQYKIFTWDKKNFPDPKGLIDELKGQGFHIVVMCDPGIKIEPGYKPYDDGLAQDVFCQVPGWRKIMPARCGRAGVTFPTSPIPKRGTGGHRYFRIMSTWVSMDFGMT